MATACFSACNDRAAMKLIEQYVFRRALALTVPALLVTTGILLTTQLLIHVDMVTRSADAAMSFGILAASLIPTIALLVAPFALLTGAIRTLNAMNSDSELAVLEAAGRAPAATGKPIVVLSALVALVSLVATHTVEPWANRKMQDTITAASTDLIRSAVQSGSFIPIRGKLFVQIGRELPNGELGQIIIVDTRDAATQVIYYAKRGALTQSEDATLFVLADGEVHRRNNNDRSISIISFATTTLDFSQLLGQATRGQRPEELPTSYLLAPPADDAVAKFKPAEIRREINRRFTEWLYPLVFGIAAVFFVGTAQSSRQQQPLRIVAGILIVLVLRAGGFFTLAGSGDNPTLALLAYALPMTAIAVFGTLVMASRAAPMPNGAIRTMDGIGNGLSGVQAAMKRLKGAARRGRRGQP